MLEKLVRTEVKMEELLGKLEALEKRQTNVETEVDTSVKVNRVWEKRLTIVETEVDTSVKVNHILEKRLTIVETEVDTSVKVNHILEKRLTDVATEVDNSTKDIQGLEKKHDIELEKSVKGIQDLEKRYDSLQKVCRWLKKFENTTKSYFDGPEKSLEVYDQRRLDAMFRNITAFFATLSSKFTSSAHQTLVFNNVVTDVGGGYNPGTGVFTGLYVFSASVMVALTTSTTYAHISIAKNGSEVVYLYVTDSDGSYETGVGTVILSLQVGDTIKLACTQSRRVIHNFSFISGLRL